MRLATCLLALSAALGAACPLASQDVSLVAGIARPGAGTLADRGVRVRAAADRVAVDPDAYVLAYRRSAKVACQVGTANALIASLADARATLQSVEVPERARVALALDSAYAQLARDGGCDALTRPTRLIVIDGFAGFAWNTSLEQIGSASKGTYTDDGFLTLTQGIKVDRLKGEAIFTFTALRGTEHLIAGRYRIPTDAKHVAGDWATLERGMATRHPPLRATRATDAPPSDATHWSTIFRNPDTLRTEASMSVRADGDRWYIVIDYPGHPGWTQR